LYISATIATYLLRCHPRLMINNLERIRKLRALQLKQMRKDKKLTQEQLEELSGVSRQTIISIEKGDMGWNSDSEQLIVEALNNYQTE